MNTKKLSLSISIFFLSLQFSSAQFVELPAPGLPYPGTLLPYIDAAKTYQSEPNGFVYSGHEDVEIPGCVTYTDKLYKYDGVSDQWSFIASLPVYRINPVVFILNGEHYYGMGENTGSTITDLSKYDSTLQTWIGRAPFPGVAKSGMTIFTRNTSAYFVCGEITNNTNSRECWEYNSITDSWSQKNNFTGVSRTRGKAWTIDSLNLLGLGVDSSYNRLNDLWLYDAVNDNWILKDSFPSAHSNTEYNFSINHAAYLHTDHEFWKYDPDSNSWTHQNNVTDTLYYGVTFCSDDKGYILTQEKMYRYDPLLNNWTTIYSDTLGILYDSKGIVVGNLAHINNLIYDLQSGLWSDDTTGSSWWFTCNGNGYATHNGNFESFDPLSQLWTSRTSPPIPINNIRSLFEIGDTAYFYYTDTANFNHLIEYDCIGDAWYMHGQLPYIGDVSFSIGNKGYMGLGYDNSVSWTTDKFYEYDPLMVTWTQKANFPGGQRQYAIGLSVNSKGYVGFGSEEALINPNDPNIYEYDPTIDTWSLYGTITGRVAGFSFADDNSFYFGNGHRRLSMSCGSLYHRDFYKSDSSFITSVTPNKLEDKISLTYPNPVRAGEEIFFSNFLMDAEVIEIADLQGRIVFKLNNPNKNYFLLPHIKAGVYLIKITSEDGRSIANKVLILE